MNASFEPKKQEQGWYSPKNKSQSAKVYPSRTIVHAKLEMTEPGDHDEQEADAVANTIVSCGKIARKISSGASGSSGIAVSSQMESQLNHLQGGGQAMPKGLRSMMESGFGQDFGQVRLHTDSEAARMSSSIHAKAFTHGNDIYFNRGQFAPETSEGQHLVAHELTHVVQGIGKVGRKKKKEKEKEKKETPPPSKTLLESKKKEQYLGLAKTMIESLISVFETISQEVGEYFWGSNFVNSKEEINGNYGKIAEEINNLLSNNNNKTSLYKLNSYEAKVHEQESEGLCIGNDIWIKTEESIDQSHRIIDQSYRDFDGRIAATIIHELSHALFNANDNAYFDYLFKHVEGWDPIKEERLTTSNPDEKTADSYSTVAYLSYFSPYILTTKCFENGFALITHAQNANRLDAKGKPTYKNIFSYSSEIEIQNPYYKYNEKKTYDETNHTVEELWKTKMELIRKAGSIDDINRIDPELSNYNNKNNRNNSINNDLYDFYEYKYQELLKKLMKHPNEFKAEEFYALYWLAKQGGATDYSDNLKSRLKELAEQHLQKH